jgi:SAM-dependent methyltransferase
MAWLYATRWGSEYHEQAYSVLDQLILKQLPRGSTILDLACGDGRLTGVLAANGFRVTGLDISEQMLKFARERNPGIEFVLGDARDFKLPMRFNAVISTFDALNHVKSPDELAQVFRSVEAALKPGGYFAFDLNREEAYTQLWSTTYAIVDPDLVSVSVGHYDAQLRTAWADFTVFRLAEQAWERSDFRMSQYCHREEDVLNSLFAAGFADAEPFDASSDLGMFANIGTGRTYYLARKGL